MAMYVPIRVACWCLAGLLLPALAGASIFNAPCRTTAECQHTYNEHYECHENHCTRELFSIRTKELLGYTLVAITSMVTNAGGVGAGTISVPTFLFFFNFVSSDAIPLSRLTIFSASLVNYIINFTNRDPENPAKFLINYEIASVMMPLLMAGTQVGVVLSRFLPAFAVTIILFSYLVHATWQMFSRARKEDAKEKEQEKSLQQDEVGAHDMTSDSIPSDQGNSAGEEPSHVVEESKVQKSVQTTVFEQEANTETRPSLLALIWENIPSYLSILSSFGMLLFLSLLKGGEGRKPLFPMEHCGIGSWTLSIGSQVVFIGLAAMLYRHNVPKFQADDAKLSKDPEVALNRDKVRKDLLLAGYKTGVLAGFLGVGGGMVLGLHMLNLGMDAQVSTALSTFVSLFSSAGASFQFVVAGAIQIRHAWLLMILGLIGSTLGNYCLKAILRKYSKPSALFWILSVVLTISAIVLPVEVVRNLLDKNKSALTFGSLC